MHAPHTHTNIEHHRFLPCQHGRPICPPPPPPLKVTPALSPGRAPATNFSLSPSVSRLYSHTTTAPLIAPLRSIYLLFYQFFGDASIFSSKLPFRGGEGSCVGGVSDKQQSSSPTSAHLPPTLTLHMVQNSPLLHTHTHTHTPYLARIHTLNFASSKKRKSK